MKKMMLLGGSILTFTLLLTSCSGSETPVATSSTPSIEASETVQASAVATQSSAPAAAQEPAVPGLAYGQMPVIPLFEIPDLGLIEESLDAVHVDLTKELAKFPGLKVSAARCDSDGVLISGQGAAVLYGDGGTVFTGENKSLVEAGDGSATYTIDGQSVVVGGDGSGVFNTDDVSIVNGGDGSGTYTDSLIIVVLDGLGGGTYTSATVSNVNDGAGGGTYTDAEQSIVNDGQGGGTYEGHGVLIVNNGDGTGLVNSEVVEMEPLDKVPALGKFPSMGALKPVKGCGTVISLETGVLFDIDKYEVRAEASEVLDTVAEALTAVAAGTVKVQGHTDSIRDDAWNQQLSEDRASAVLKALESRGATGKFEAEGFGESQPVANNETDVGRQLNRRVEIFIPSA